MVLVRLISLAVRTEASAFYEKFGFTSFGGNAAQNWLILKNGDHIIGLFQGMFEKNILTFNGLNKRRNCRRSRTRDSCAN
jgi:hypothetical protein